MTISSMPSEDYESESFKFEFRQLTHPSAETNTDEYVKVRTTFDKDGNHLTVAMKLSKKVEFYFNYQRTTPSSNDIGGK